MYYRFGVVLHLVHQVNGNLYPCDQYLDTLNKTEIQKHLKI